MDLKQTIKNLERKERESMKRGYLGDATSRAFQRHLLILLSDISGNIGKKKRKRTAWNKFLSGYLKSGKTIQEAAKDWKSEKEKKKE